MVRAGKQTQRIFRDQQDRREHNLFDSLLGEGQSGVSARELRDALEDAGLYPDDPRLTESLAKLRPYRRTELGYAQFCDVIRPSIVLVERALRGELVIPDFPAFRREIEAIYEQVKDDRSGAVADYIPQLSRVDPDQWAASVCTVDGQRLDLGDAEVDFCVQSTCKPINYCLALEEHGEDKVHQHVGREPSGVQFNELVLNSEGRPHNPLINAGAIVCCSLVKPQLDPADRFDYVMRQWRALCGGRKVSFSNSVYLSERQTADRNFALGYYLRENDAFPAGTDLLDTLEFYFQCCSIELDTRQMAGVAATLANGGVCPISGERVLRPDTVQKCLSLMYSCGMYDFSGEFAFSVGLPAKSGVAGALMIVVPNVMGICTWSPRLDKHGNSVRGVAFCRELVRRFNFHQYDNLTGISEKIDPRRPAPQQEAMGPRDQTRAIVEGCWAASKGDLVAIQKLIASGAELSEGDYDGRTPLHLAAAEGHLAVVGFLLEHGAEVNPRDRWGQTPLDEALRHDHEALVKLLRERGGREGSELA